MDRSDVFTVAEDRPRRSASTPSVDAFRLAARLMQPLAEYGSLLRDPFYWGVGVPRGDGHPVMVLPGLLAGDFYLQPMRDWLLRVGYWPVPSGLSRNPGWSEELVEELGDRAERQYERSGRHVTIIGHSMGGVLGRSIAVRRPHVIRHVITLGSPVRVGRKLPDTVAVAAIYSREDRIVRYPMGVAEEARAQNLEVPGSHSGLAVNPAVYRRLGELLPRSATL
jgi:pimeloyl-ACP methyl ester carboxylesterase